MHCLCYCAGDCKIITTKHVWWATKINKATEDSLELDTSVYIRSLPCSYCLCLNDRLKCSNTNININSGRPFYSSGGSGGNYNFNGWLKIGWWYFAPWNTLLFFIITAQWIKPFGASDHLASISFPSFHSTVYLLLWKFPLSTFSLFHHLHHNSSCGVSIILFTRSSR